jgi:hypothetical protein
MSACTPAGCHMPAPSVPGPVADVAVVGPVPAQMWQQRVRRARSWRRCGRLSPVPVQMRPGQQRMRCAVPVGTGGPQVAQSAIADAPHSRAERPHASPRALALCAACTSRRRVARLYAICHVVRHVSSRAACAEPRSRHLRRVLLRLDVRDVDRLELPSAAQCETRAIRTGGRFATARKFPRRLREEAHTRPRKTARHRPVSQPIVEAERRARGSDAMNSVERDAVCRMARRMFREIRSQGIAGLVLLWGYSRY